MAIRYPNKRRAVISYENMSDELREAFEEKYPHGYADYLALADEILEKISGRGE